VDFTVEIFNVENFLVSLKKNNEIKKLIAGKSAATFGE